MNDHVIYLKKRQIKLRREQKFFVHLVRTQTCVFALGPAGTGKTFISAACGLDFLERNLTKRIILTRPTVSAGEDLGYLPGDLSAKIDPFLRPLFDALERCSDRETISEYLKTRTVEILPLAYMRGRDLNDSIIICDEAQNMTHSQLKMLLTRVGRNSKIIISGDETQTDIPDSGLFNVAETVAYEVAGASIIYLTDVQRSKFCAEVAKVL